MKLKIFALFCLLYALLGIASARADDKLHLYLECSQGQKCIDLARDDGRTESVLATPIQTLAKSDIKSASIQMGGNSPRSMEIKLSGEASKRFEEITEANIGRKLMVVLDNRILIAPTVKSPITGGRILISGGLDGQNPFWAKVPWLQDLITDSHRASGRSVMIYAIIAAAISISALVFVLLPRMRRTGNASRE